jgi:hypothetical protein
VNGSTTGAAPAAPQHEPVLGELRERVLEGGEVPTGERVDRPPLRPCGTHPPGKHLRPRLSLHLRLVDERQQDPQLGAVVQLPGEQRQRVDAKRRTQLIVAEPQQLLQPSRAGALPDVAVRVDRRIVANSAGGDPSADSVIIVTESSHAQL